MSENKFTPGPWVVRKWDGDKWPDKRISITSKYNGEALFINARYANDIEENANLIAAAPELLEALEDMVAGWKYIRGVYGDLYGVGWDRAEISAIKAISKAKGE